MSIPSRWYRLRVLGNHEPYEAGRARHFCGAQGPTIQLGAGSRVALELRRNDATRAASRSNRYRETEIFTEYRTIDRSKRWR